MNYTMSSLNVTPGIVPCIGPSRAMQSAASRIFVMYSKLAKW